MAHASFDRFFPAFTPRAVLSLACIVGISGLAGCNSFSPSTSASGAPVAAFSFSPAAPATGQFVSFTDATTNSPTVWSWSFGDSSTSTVQNPTHSYTSAGAYVVTLTATNSAGSNSINHTVTVSTSSSTTLNYPIVQTGQVACFNTTAVIPCPSSGQAYYGQDAQYSLDSTFSYTLSADSKTVKDNITGLTWMRGPNTTLASPLQSDKMSYSAAQSWIATVNAMRYGGFSDWRLPSLKELYSLYRATGTDPSNFTGTNTSVLTPYINTSYFNFAYGETSAGARIIDSQYATTNAFVQNPDALGDEKVFGVNFADGRIKGYDQVMPNSSSFLFFVQLVRGPTTYGINSFVNNGDGTITDTSTGLMWAQEDNGARVLWENALVWAQSMNAANYLGYSDWRVPSVKELQSIVDYSNAPDYNGLPAINTAFFKCSSITNEAGEADYPYYWTSTTHEGYSTSGPAGGSADYVAFGRALGYDTTLKEWIDWHGAGAQRSDPTVAPPYSYASVYTTTVNGVSYTGYAFGPELDALRGLNYVRLVRTTP